MNTSTFAMAPKGDQRLVKRIHRGLLLRLLRCQRGLSRTQLASESGLAKSTVSLLVKELIVEGWVAEMGSPTALGMGRPSTPLEIDGRSRAIVGIEISREAMQVVCVSLTGQVLGETRAPFVDTKITSVCTQVAQMVASIRTRMRRRGVNLWGVGVGVPGETTGLLRFLPNPDWRKADFVPLITHAMAQAGLSNMPLHVQNEAGTAALGEYEFGEGNAKEALIFVSCGSGVEAGIVLNGRLFNGARGVAGEIGHSILQMDGPPCSCGRKGCVESFLGSMALSKLPDPHSGGGPLGVVLHNLWTTFNPRALVVGGPSCEKYPGMVDIARTTLQRYAGSAGMEAPQVHTPRYGLLASAVGAAALVLHHDLRPFDQHDASHPHVH